MFLKKFYALNKTTANIYIFFQYKENRDFFLINYANTKIKFIIANANKTIIL